MITKEEQQAYLREGVPEEILLPAEYDNVEVWKKYILEDDKAIFGGGSNDPRMIYFANRILAKIAGVEMYMPSWGRLVDIGAGYNSIQGLTPINVQYYPVDILRHTPLTILIEPGEIGFEDSSMNCVTCCNVFQHLHKDERQKYVEEAFRVLEPSGMLFVATNMDVGIVNRPLEEFRDGRSYAITGDYLVACPDTEELNNWSEVTDGEFKFIQMNLSSRGDGFGSVWYKKVPIEGADTLGREKTDES